MAGNDQTNQASGNVVSSTIGLHLEYEIISTTNSFFGTVRNITLDSGYVSELDLSELHQLLYDEKNDLPAAERAARSAILLKKLRGELDAIDQQLDPSKFRRVFERIGDPGTHSLELVIQYYFSKSARSKEDRDKVDLLVTRWGSYSVPGTQKLPVLRPAKDLESKLVDLYNSLGLALEQQEKEEEILNTLKSFSEEIGSIANFREIVEKQLVRRLREYKAQMEDFFYRPRVLSRLVEVNIAIHNLFQQLYDSEQARLHIYLEQAKRSALNDEQTRQLPQFQPIFKMMNRAAQMDHLLDDIKQALASQQVIDQAFVDELERAGRKMRDLTELLVGTLQNSRSVSEQLHKSLSNIQRLEKLTVIVSAMEKQLLENIASHLGLSLDQLANSIFENAIVTLAEAVNEDRLAEAFPNRSDRVQTAISTLIGAGFTSSSGH
jgi:hypothetical protein